MTDHQAGESGLLPCPFCGEPGETGFSDGEDYVAGCPSFAGSAFGCRVAPFSLSPRSLEEAIAAWNTRAPDMRAALEAAAGYLMNAKIDLETGAPKRTAIATIEGGIKVVREALGEPK